MGPRAPQSVRTDEAPRTTGRERKGTGIQVFGKSLCLEDEISPFREGEGGFRGMASKDIPKSKKKLQPHTGKGLGL